MVSFLRKREFTVTRLTMCNLTNSVTVQHAIGRRHVVLVRIGVGKADDMTEGWYWAYPLPKRHFFVKGKSLCGKATVYGGDMRPDSQDTANNCPECVRAAAKRKPSDTGKSDAASVLAAAFDE